MDLKDLLVCKIPLIAIHTNDELNIRKILEYTLSSKNKKAKFIKVPNTTALLKITTMIDTYGFMLEPDAINYNELHRLLEKQDKVLILVNPEHTHDAIYDAGYITTPISLIEARLKNLLEDTSVIKYFLPILKDLTLKQIDDIIKLSSYIYGDISEQSLYAVKRKYNTVTTGVQSVDTKLKFYYKIPKVEQWLQSQGRLIHHHIPKELKPRGLLFHGGAGVGKTYSAKRIADKLEIPLYRLDLGALMGKYVGQSEQNLEKALATIESASPCVMLIDEIEKIFQSTGDSGVSDRLLSQLLWWLQEHQSNVITIMTTNNRSALPKELYRAGRVDSSVLFTTLNKEESLDFCERLCEVYKEFITTSEAVQGIKSLILDMIDDSRTYANITELVISEVRKTL